MAIGIIRTAPVKQCDENKDNKKRPSYCIGYHQKDDAVDHIVVMMKQEENVYHSSDYLSLSHIHEVQLNNNKQEVSPQNMRLALEECIHFIDSLCTTTSSSLPSSSSIQSRNTADVDFISSIFGLKKKMCESTSTESTFLLEDESIRRQVGLWRGQMCAWAFTVVDKYNFNRETVAIAMSFLDRYLSTEDELDFITCKRFQLISMTALYTAIKIMEPNKALPIDILVDMSRGYFRVDDVKTMEMDMLGVLNWRLNPPTTLAFVREFISLLPVSMLQRKMLLTKSRYLTELAVGDSSIIGCRSSSVAIAALIVSTSFLSDCDYDLRFPSCMIDEFGKDLMHYISVDVRSHEITRIVDRLEYVYQRQKVH